MNITRRRLTFGLGAVGMTSPSAVEQAMRTIHQPFDIETFGAFSRMVLDGDFTPKVMLSAVMAKHPTVGVGAVADARGEITIYDGKLIVSYGKAAPHRPLDGEAAALLAVGTAPTWRIVTVAQDVAPSEIEAFLGATAKAHGLDPDETFPFQLHGTLAPYVMHVNVAPTNGPHGMGYPVALTGERKGDALEGGVAGLYVAPDLVGIATHGGTRTHSHFVSPDGDATAHLDSWGLKAGAVLLLP